MIRNILFFASASLALFALVVIGTSENAVATAPPAGKDIHTTAIDMNPSSPAANTALTIGAGSAGIDPGDIQDQSGNVAIGTSASPDGTGHVCVELVVDEVPNGGTISGGTGIFGPGVNIIYNGAIAGIVGYRTGDKNQGRVLECNTDVGGNPSADPDDFLHSFEAPAGDTSGDSGGAVSQTNSAPNPTTASPNITGNFRIDNVWTDASEFGPGRLLQVNFRCLATGSTTIVADDDDLTGTGSPNGPGVLFAEPAPGGVYDIANALNGTLYCNTTPALPSAQLDVSKAYVASNGSAPVTIQVSCDNGATAIPIAGDDQASPGDPAHFTITRPVASVSCTATETSAGAGYVQSATGCNGLTINGTGPFSCTITNTAVATYTVTKDFVPNSGLTANVQVSCTSGTVDAPNPKPITDGNSAVFTIRGFAAGATCTATEPTPPAGYQQFIGDCVNDAINPGGSPTCTLSNQTQAFLTITKTASGGSPGEVTLDVSCTSGSVNEDDPTAVPGGDTAEFTIEGFNPGATCTVTEPVVPNGYEFSAGTCPTVTLNHGDNNTCTVTNTEIIREIIISKEFSDDAATQVIATVVCDDPDTAVAFEFGDNTVGEGAPIKAYVQGNYVPASTTCDVTEPDLPSYQEDETDCENLSLAANTGCTLVNFAIGTITISKDYVPNNSDVVGFTLSCNDATAIDTPNPRNALEGTPAVFTLTGFAPATRCNATESGVLTGYAQTTTCLNLDPAAGADVPCTVTNEQASTTFTMTKNFVPTASAQSLSVTLNCPGTTGTITPVDTSITGHGDTAQWTISGFTQGDTCSVDENLTDLNSYEVAGCQNVALAQTTTTCTMTNTTIVQYEVAKDFIPNNAAAVSVTINCGSTSGTLTPAGTTQSVSEGPAQVIWTLRGHTAGDSCTITETPVPSGYSVSYHSNCTGFALGYTVSAITCTITNTQNATTLVVTKIENWGGGNVTTALSVSCANTNIVVTPTDNTAVSDGGDTAEFALSGWNTGTLAGNGNGCGVNETLNPGFHLNGTNCPVANLVAGGNTTCIVDNALNSVIVRVSKDFVPDDPQGVLINPQCANQGSGPFSAPVTSTDNTAHEAANDYVEFTITGFTDEATTCSFVEDPPTGTWSKNEADCANKTLVTGTIITCTITNSASLTFLVKKDWSPDNGSTPVSVTLSCPGATVTPAGAQNATEATPASFTVNGFSSVPTCTATESPIPSGYFASGSPAGTCQALASAGECTITNTQRSWSWTVETSMADSREPPVMNWVFDCGGNGTITNADTTSTDQTDGGFTLVGFSIPVTCNASYTAAPGYFPGAGTCNAGLASDGTNFGTFTCGVGSNPNQATFTVDKDFTNDSTSTDVDIQLTCTGAQEIATDAFGGAADNVDTANEATDAVFYVRYMVPGDTCTATETTALPGLSVDQSQCANKAMVIGPAFGNPGQNNTCTITNADTVYFTVRKDWQPIDGRQVLIKLVCTPAATITIVDATAGQFDPADFVIQNFVSGTTCTASETTPAGYTSNQLDCQGFNPTKATCTIINRKGAEFPTFTPTGPGGSPPPTAPPVTPAPGTPRPTRTPRPGANLSGVTILGGLF